MYDMLRAGSHAGRSLAVLALYRHGNRSCLHHMQFRIKGVAVRVNLKNMPVPVGNHTADQTGAASDTQIRISFYTFIHR